MNELILSRLQSGLDLVHVTGDAKLEKEKALERFLMEVEKRAYIMAKMAVGNPDDALDLLQDAMTVFVSRYGDRDDGEWSGLFYRILQNRIRDWYRRSKVRNRWRVWFNRSDEAGEEVFETFADEKAEDPFRLLWNDAASAAIIEALETLPLRQQQAFLLRVWEGMSVSETSKTMVCSEGSVKTHLSRAMQSLRLCLEEFRS